MKLINGDCMTVLEQLIDTDIKIDLILTDPPYGTTANNWDSILPFNDMWKLLDQLSTNITTSLIFGSEPFSTQLKQSNLSDFKYDLYWIKNKVTGFVHAKNKPLKNIELISVFSKGTTVHKNQSKNRMTYNPQGLIKVDKVQKAGANKFGTLYGKRPSHKQEFYTEYTNYPKMTFEFNTVPSIKSVHPTQKPVELLEYLIKTYSNEGDVVLDFTMGSGSTGVACKNTNREFIGIELDESYFKIAKDRICNQARLI